MVVTRFAPSPTGYLHVGGARTALFNWLYARRTGGKFILRIEDTDLKRNTPTAMRQVIEDLRWLGIEWDEGPDVDGPNGPYLQSQRRDIYDRYIRKLIDEGKAYYCFETAEELGALRDEATAGKQGFVYQRPEVFATHEEAEKARAEGRPVTVRFVVPQDEPIVVKDLVRGEVRFGPGEVKDFIIMKSDGFPTYHFAVVVDDELMGVTHVIRGQEHLMNTPGHQALQKALGFRTPEYAHMSVTVSETGGKLSKRERPKALRAAIAAAEDLDPQKVAAAGGIDIEEFNAFVTGKSTPDMPAIDAMAEYLGVQLPEINVVDFFRSGYLPETMVNFLALLGWNPGDGREVMTVDELVGAFDLSRIAKSNSLFDRKKLLAFNTEHIRMVGPEKLCGHLRRYLEEVHSPVASADDETLLRLIRICEGARTLADIDRKCRFLFVANDVIHYDEKAVQKVLVKGDGLAILAIVRQRLAALEAITPESIETVLRSLAEEKQIGLGKVAQPLRVAICGTTVSPPIFDSVELLGLDNTLARIDIALQRFRE
ncbi:MAG TPA: glutamate--tRNA ligase [Anaerohalosphaeraceae bacterium]|jgi:glutamyl-tRNA synthetase|nr:glutamate--tRNA ligase [Anaerohalosphaeraceae bacterium]HRT51612.1 glutamate--tRNA ligase [Anaerohalosphaeraceae bacterium]HRT87628.1 glutamate--tRNA ligase [Anaerohalosphaeraceae bacterium]